MESKPLVSAGIGEVCMDGGVALPLSKLQNLDLMVHLQCPYTTSYIVGNMQEELGFSSICRAIGIKDMSPKGDIMVGVCYGPSNQEMKKPSLKN